MAACTEQGVAELEDATVEQFLQRHCEQAIAELRRHGLDAADKLRAEYAEGARLTRGLLEDSLQGGSLIVILKCVGGPHIGQKFRLEPSTSNGDDAFKVGRSTGRHFKEKGVSLYKDKEISTTHAKIELRHGQVFLVDVRSTNGTLLNGAQVESQVPYRLKEGDLLTFGTTELRVAIAEAGDESAAQ